MATTKFRPSLTKIEILYLLELCNEDTNESRSKVKKAIQSKLQLLTVKIDLGITAPAYSANEKVSLEDRLGFGITKADERKSAYDLWKSNPTLCTESQIKLAKTYMFENDLMSEEEEKEFLEG